jgi:hypothetical protein
MRKWFIRIRYQTRSTDPPPLRSRGWPSVRDVLPAVIKHLHYRTQADGLIVVVDSDLSVPRPLPDSTLHVADCGCRLCELRGIVQSVRRQLRDVPGREPLKVAVGMAVPAIEAWYAFGRHPAAAEATWFRAMRDNQFPYTKKSLKELIYGTSRPSIEMETRRAVEESTRIRESLDFLQQHFPAGFGALVHDLRGW